MPRVAVDPRLLQDALVFEGPRRQFLVLLALGKLTAITTDPDDDSLMRSMASRVSEAKINPSGAVDPAQVDEWRAKLPPGAPPDMRFVYARELSDIVKRLVDETTKRHPELQETSAGVDLSPF